MKVVSMIYLRNMLDVSDVKMSTDEESSISPCLRPLSCELGVLSRPDGSASFTQGGTTVVVAVYGPAEVRTSRELIDRAIVEVVYNPKVGQSGPEERAIEKLIAGVCESTIITTVNPHTAYTVVIQEVQVRMN